PTSSVMTSASRWTTCMATTFAGGGAGGAGVSFEQPAATSAAMKSATTTRLVFTFFTVLRARVAPDAAMMRSVRASSTTHRDVTLARGHRSDLPMESRDLKPDVRLRNAGPHRAGGSGRRRRNARSHPRPAHDRLRVP